MRTTLKPLLLALSIAAGTAMTAHAQTAPSYTIPNDGTLLNVSAEAEAKRVPDIATVSAGVVTQAVDGNAAMRQNAEQMSKVMTAVKAAGIADKDVQTSGINLNPQYSYKENEAPKIIGYQASNTVSLNALVAQGANDINGPSFSIDQPEPVYDEARVAALKKAQARAETYAKSLGLKVRRIVSISEGRSGGGVVRPMMMAASMRSAKAEMDTQVAPGESTLSITLDVTFELGR
ncbi:SIMPL domain-containing protein [Xanthomonas campestris]|uniref:SIMPL domain-containing protein n=1 Tax=Xanthomonas campestris TaxID=339 RepID=UPI002379C87E|nr:SIMPL domain-containing protein [Xanthomonas campestris]WDL28725.1 SIMPL domain-containing protein [Xanthomonas campestris pv. campestris]